MRWKCRVPATLRVVGTLLFVWVMIANSASAAINTVDAHKDQSPNDYYAPCDDPEVTFTGYAAGEGPVACEYNWDFGDGNSSGWKAVPGNGIISEIHEYADAPNKFTSTLTVRGVTGSDLMSDTADVWIVSNDMLIYRGQNGAVVPDQDQDSDGVEDEEDIGSFTVANLNDTNGDGTADNGQNPVNANGNLGRDEIDLMKIELLDEIDPETITGDLRLTIESGDVKIWSTATKTAEISGDDLEFSVGDPSKTWYVEARAATALRGISLKYEFRGTGSDEWILLDKVTATGVWADCTKQIEETQTAAQVNTTLGADAQYNTAGEQGAQNVMAAVNALGGTGVGKQLAGFHGNTLVLEFRITPNDIYSVPEFYGDGTTRARPYFDVSRKMQGAYFVWYDNENGPTQVQVAGHELHPHFPETVDSDNEYANDDSADGDENDEPTDAGRMWVIDAPSISISTNVLRMVRDDFREFVRMGTGSTDVGADGYAVRGSRCSGWQGWYSKTTKGLTETPNVIATGTGFAFQREALHTEASSTTTTAGKRHHGVMRGLELASTTGATAETCNLLLIDDDTIDDTLDAVANVSEVGKIAAGGGNNATLIGDQTAYTGVGYFASRFDGEIAGEDGVTGETTAELAHEIDVGGGNPQSPNVSITGTAFTLPSPDSPITMTIGTITTVTITETRAEADSSGGGNQTVNVILIDDDGIDDPLHSFNVSVPRLMVDDAAGTPNVTAIKYGLLNVFTTSLARIAAKADGEVIGPDGESGEQNAEIAYEIDMSGSNPQSSSVTATGPVYTMPAPSIGTNPIPIDGSSTVTMSSIYIEATGSTGDEDFKVRVVDENIVTDTTLHELDVTITRPADCFPDALIGPPATAPVGTITNPAPGGEVKGPDGASGEQVAEIAYEIGSSSTNSPTVSVTATAP